MIIHEQDGELYQSKIIPKKNNEDSFTFLEKEVLDLPKSVRASFYLEFQGTRVAGRIAEIQAMLDVTNLKGNRFYQFGETSNKAYFWTTDKLKVIKIFEYGIRYPVLTELLAMSKGIQFKADRMLDLSRMFENRNAFMEAIQLFATKGNLLTEKDIANISKEFAIFWHYLMPYINVESRKLEDNEINCQLIDYNAAINNEMFLSLIRKRK